MDQAILSARGMPAPPAGNQYEAWLIGGEQSLSLGILSLDSSRMGMLIYNDNQSRNLLSVYDRAVITLKPIEGSNPDVPGQVVFAYTLPSAGLEYVRSLLVSYPLAPEQVALIQGLHTAMHSIEQSAKEMSSAYDKDDLEGTQKNAQAIMNILVGNRSPDYKDGPVTILGEAYGFLPNGDNLGYIEAVYAYADYAVNAPSASQNMIINGEIVKVCAQNLALWAPQLREQIRSILTATSLAAMDQPVRASVLLADQMLNGLDKNTNGEIEPASGECGVLTTYEYAYQMADMPLLPVGIIGAPSPASTTLTAGPTNPAGGSNNGGTAPTVKPKKPPPGQENRPPRNNNGNNDH